MQGLKAEQSQHHAQRGDRHRKAGPNTSKRILATLELIARLPKFEVIKTKARCTDMKGKGLHILTLRYLDSSSAFAVLSVLTPQSFVL